MKKKKEKECTPYKPERYTLGFNGWSLIAKIRFIGGLIYGKR